MNAKSQSFTGEEACRLVADAEKIYVAGDKSIVEFAPATADKKEILAKITGRTGNLRAPALRSGKVLFYIGYNAALYDLL